MKRNSQYQTTFTRLAKSQRPPPKFLKVSRNPETDRLTFFFSAPGRTNLRQLQSGLEESLGCPVELRQVGSREQAAALGGIGICGRELCCAHWLAQPLSVPTKTLEKIEGPLSHSRITGACGKLLCCLLFEQDDFQCPVREKSHPEPEPSFGKEKAAAPPPEKKPPTPQPKPKPAKKRRVRRLIIK
ncbi:hypothetical protein L6258_01345 [Candidatus Parcubacteria bacterium]|nr:hypothetical protein [Candidatus Parcubacteria bacterium]